MNYEERSSRVLQRLITLPLTGPRVLAFQQEPHHRKVEWYPSLELASLDLVARFVAAGYGVWLSLAIPGNPLPKKIRALPWEGFPEVTFYAITNGPQLPMAKLVIEEAERIVAAF